MSEFAFVNRYFVLLIFVFLIVAFNIFYIKFLKWKILSHEQERQITELEHLNEMQYIFFHEKNKNDDELKRLRHDLKNHLILIKDKNVINNKDYYEELFEIVEREPLVLTGCKVFDILVNEKKKVAEDYGISFRVQIVKDISGLNNMKERDLCSIFGNVLDNAIESAAEIVDGYVDIKVDIVNFFFYMIISNSFHLKNVNEVDGKFQSSKRDRDIHGIGLENVKIALKKCEGYLKIKHGKSVFTVEIMIPLNDSDK